MNTQTKNTTLRPTAIAVVILIAALAGCKKSDSLSAKQVNTNMLTSHVWKLQSLQVDNVDKTSLYTGMPLTVGAATYTSTNGAPVWAASGTLSFTDDGKTKRDDQVDVSVDQITDAQLVLSLTWNKTTLGGGRTSSVSGKHVYTFVK